MDEDLNLSINQSRMLISRWYDQVSIIS